MRPLFKTTIVIWSETDRLPLQELAADAVIGDSYCSRMESMQVEDPSADPDWDGTEFFDDPFEDLDGPDGPHARATV